MALTVASSLLVAFNDFTGKKKKAKKYKSAERTGRSYQGLQKKLRELGVESKVMTKGLGQVTLVLGEIIKSEVITLVIGGK